MHTIYELYLKNIGLKIWYMGSTQGCLQLGAPPFNNTNIFKGLCINDKQNNNC